MTSPVRSIKRVVTKAGYEDMIKSLLQSLLFPIREDSGCLSYDIWEGLNGREFVAVGELERRSGISYAPAIFPHGRIYRRGV